MAYIVMAYTVMAHAVMAYTAMAYTVMASIVMAYVVPTGFGAAHVHANVCTRVRTHAYAHISTQVCTHVDAHVHAHVGTHVHACGLGSATHVKKTSIKKKGETAEDLRRDENQICGQRFKV